MTSARTRSSGRCAASVSIAGAAAAGAGVAGITVAGALGAGAAIGTTMGRSVTGGTAATGVGTGSCSSVVALSVGKAAATSAETHGSATLVRAFAQRLEHERDAIEIVVERVEQRRRSRHRRVAGDEPRFHQVRELAETHRAGHARAALERVQRAAQLARVLVAAGLAAPRAELLAGLRKELRRLFEEDRQARHGRRRRARRQADRSCTSAAADAGGYIGASIGAVLASSGRLRARAPAEARSRARASPPALRRRRPAARSCAPPHAAPARLRARHALRRRSFPSSGIDSWRSVSSSCWISPASTASDAVNPARALHAARPARADPRSRGRVPAAPRRAAECRARRDRSGTAPATSR